MADMDLGSDEVPLMTHERSRDYERPTSRTRQRNTFCGCLSHILRPCIAEAVGVTLFVFLGSMSGLSGDGVAIAMAHGLTIMVLIIAFGSLSGGHFNPCVTLGAALGGGIHPCTSICYIIAQIVGSVLGASLTMGVLSAEKYKSISGGMPGLGPDVTVWQGILCESILTFLLVSMVLMSAVDTNENILAPAAIGLSISVDILAAGSISGAVMNPARAFGPTLLWSSEIGTHAWSHHYIYWGGPIIGATLAALFYRLIFGSSQKRLLCRD